MIKSQDDLNKPETHSTEVLLEAISKLEKTTKELEKDAGYMLGQNGG